MENIEKKSCAICEKNVKQTDIIQKTYVGTKQKKIMQKIKICLQIQYQKLNLIRIKKTRFPTINKN